MLDKQKQDEIIIGIIKRSGGMVKTEVFDDEQNNTRAGLTLEMVRYLIQSDNYSWSAFESMDNDEVIGLYSKLLFDATDSEAVFSTVHESLAGIVADFIACEGWVPAITILQKTLNIIGKKDNMMSMLECDGEFGPKTVNAWKWYVQVIEDDRGKPNYKNLTWFRRVFLDQRFYGYLEAAKEDNTLVAGLAQQYTRMIALRGVR